MQIVKFVVPLVVVAGLAGAQPSRAAWSGPTAARGSAAQGMGRGEGSLQPGDPAPDFDLQALHSTARVRLSAFKHDRPVALVFGSYT